MIAYLKEIGVQTPISSFMGSESTEQMPIVSYAENERHQTETGTKLSKVMPVVALEVAEPEIGQSKSKDKQPAQIEKQYTVRSTVLAHDLTVLQQQAETCKACDLVNSRNRLVFGSGNMHADLVFIGDAPGRDEDTAGLPFVGRSGELFERMLASIQLDREQVYLMNGVKCRPQNSRAPNPNEFAACERWLVSQLDMLQPRLICMLGRVVAESLLQVESSLAELRANRFSLRGIPVVVIDHPSYLLRSQKHKRRAWQDLNALKDYYQKLQP